MEHVFPQEPYMMAAPAASRRAKKAYPTYGESWAVLGWYLLASVVAGIPMLLLLNWLPKDDAERYGLAIASIAPALLVWFLKRYAGPSRVVPASWQSRYDGAGLYAILTLAGAALLLVRAPVEWLGLPTWALPKALLQLATQPLLSFVVLCVMAPVFEEWLFRGVLLPGLMKNYGPTKAILQTSLLFGIIHFNPAQSLAAALFGVFLGWLYYRTGSLRACILVHAVNNFIAWLGIFMIRNDKDVLEQLTKSEGPTLPMAAAALGAAAVLVLVVRYLQRLTREPAEDEVVIETNSAVEAV
ncbi:CPBP family intramembrane metalloprotease [Hymenobacter oligotrophus]|uniref:CPBP family intramembrane metalloprotease n=1 Tax=Hymenobacter oligotrophus TaxID=2319843 RepID=A0A3B7R051_9BACT|nr:type II CAAX endopeptidase family protein [Hymenobacter oligotrophus]AYA36690.1 CPBP family intramembrane metalloprotease [Hymenobacter oligotrophus]